MARFCACMSWFLFCLTPTLITVAALAVPEDAFAETGDCADYCQKKCATNSDPYTCGMSCNSYCGSSCDNCKFYPQDQTNCEIDCAYGGNGLVPNQCQSKINPNGTPGGCVSGGKQCTFAGLPSSCAARLNMICDCPDPR